MKRVKLPNKPWALSRQEILEDLDASSDQGLNAAQIKTRRERYGPNRLRKIKSKSWWTILGEQFKSLMVVLLAAAAALAFVFGDWVEGLAIGAVIVINAAIGFFTEFRAVRSMEALYRLSRVNAKVRREGKVQEIFAEELVPGDIVILEGGDIITADLRLIEASKLQADESALTGESMPVSKRSQELEEDIPLAERANMLFNGTAVTRGSGEGVVVATGMNTELGQISSLVEKAEDQSTPLQERLDQLGQKLIWVTLAIAAFVAVAGILAGKELFLMIETSIALAVAAVPEGLPIVATIALARGMWRMASHNALVNRLSAVETLGATSVICTDKTGTLTENRMTVTRIAFESGEIDVAGEGLGREGKFTRNGEQVDPSNDKVLREALEIGVLCNNASLQEEDDSPALGDPLEVALAVAAFKAGIRRNQLVGKMPEVREEAFDPEVKMMATFHAVNDGYRIAVKGAPEAVINVCSLIRTEEGDRELSIGDQRRWLERNDRMAKEGDRILALATKTVDAINSEPYEHLTFLGLIGLLDPPRTDVREAITECVDAGIRVIMVTGDQPETALKVGQAVGLTDQGQNGVIQGRDLKSPDNLMGEDRQRLLRALIFARVSPKQKLELIALHQTNSSIVAMTGDGVNDAPALKKANIGVAMGKRGTQVAREAADMILKDDAFSTIVLAIQQGRVIFANIRKFVLYLMSCNISEIMVISLASVVNAPLPILPLQILFLNLVTDVFPALALGVGDGDPTIMKHSPRDPKEPILARRQWLAIGGYGVLITTSTLGAFALALTWLEMDASHAVTVSFLTLAFAQLWNVFNMRDRGSRFLRNDIACNRYVWGALALCTGLLLVAVYLPGLSGILEMVDPGASGWILILGASLVPWAVGQILKPIRLTNRIALNRRNRGVT